MSWQLHLTAYPVRHIHILPGSPNQLAVSDTRHHVQFYDLDTGAHYADLDIDPYLLDNDVAENRRLGLEALKAPNHAYLPFVEFDASHMYVSEDGKLRLIHDLNAGITLEAEAATHPLDLVGNGTVVKTALDRELGTVLAINEENTLHIFQQHNRTAALPLEDAEVVHLFTKIGGSEIILIEPDKVRLMDARGKLIREQPLHYTIGTAALSPNGNHLLIADADHQLIRLYNRDLIPIRQQHAIDLVSHAKQLQLFADTPAAAAPLVSLDIDNQNRIAFAMAGVICVSHTDHMTDLPQPRLLL